MASWKELGGCLGDNTPLRRRRCSVLLRKGWVVLFRSPSAELFLSLILLQSCQLRGQRSDLGLTPPSARLSLDTGRSPGWRLSVVGGQPRKCEALAFRPVAPNRLKSSGRCRSLNPKPYALWRQRGLPTALSGKQRCWGRGGARGGMRRLSGFGSIAIST